MAGWCEAQVDPEKRQLFQLGYNQSLQGIGPVAAYGYYYLNLPDWPRTGQTLRLAVAPVYVDSELAFREALGPQTHLALGAAGGAFADGHAEVRGGRYLKEESFNGNGGEATASAYHLFNPGAQIPLNGVVRAGFHYADYDRGSRTAAGFTLPEDTGTLKVRTGLRWGGREPLLTPNAAMELSAWYEGDFRSASGAYGLALDRATSAQTHQFWSRALLAYTMPERGDYFSVSVTAGTSLTANHSTVTATTGKATIKANGGDLVCVSNFPTATLDLPVESSQANDELMFVAFAEKIPPRGTKVRLVFIPRTMQSRDQ